MSTQFDPIQSVGLNPGLLRYRRPNLQWASISTVNVEDQIVTGVSGDCTILFSDGKLLTVNSTAQTRFDITRNASLSGTKLSGLRTGAEAANTNYALYAVRATDNDNTWVTVGDVVFPVNSSITTLNTNFGTNKWIYIGWIRNGNNSSQTTDIVKFVQTGHIMYFYESNTSNIGRNLYGIKYASTAAATQLTYTATFGSGITDLPPNVGMAYWNMGSNQTLAGSPREFMLADSQLNVASGTSPQFFSISAGNVCTVGSLWIPAQQGAACGNSGGITPAMSIYLAGTIDNALGVGSNPLV